MKLCKICGWVLFVVFASFLAHFPAYAANSSLTLALADSTCVTMKKVGGIFSQRTNIELQYICQSSGLLAKGITEGAISPDYFLSANNKWMTAVVEAGYVTPENVKINWRNQLVVTSFPSKIGDLELRELNDLLTPTVKNILIGDPKIAPFGIYAKHALINAGMWDQIQPKLKINPKISLSIRSLKKLSLATPGIVAFLYKTNVTDKMQIHFVVPPSLYPPIKYFSAPLVRAEKKYEMTQFLDFICGKEAKEIFSAAGFIVNSPPQDGSVREGHHVSK